MAHRINEMQRQTAYERLNKELKRTIYYPSSEHEWLVDVFIKDFLRKVWVVEVRVSELATFGNQFHLQRSTEYTLYESGKETFPDFHFSAIWLCSKQVLTNI